MSGHHHPCYRLLGMTVLSFASMYILMYAMVDTFGNALNNLNQVYMAALMAAPMILIELGLMGRMYPNRTLNLAVSAIAVVAVVGFFLLIRQQVAIGDSQFLRSMIPHHAAAILMCEKAQVQEVEIRDLCRTIIASQQAEIDQMKRLPGK
jgi:hypothetical protein